MQIILNIYHFFHIISHKKQQQSKLKRGVREVRATSRRRSGGERGDRTGGVGERAREHPTMSRRRSGGGGSERANGARAIRATNERSEAERAEERAHGSQVLKEISRKQQQKQKYGGNT